MKINRCVIGALFLASQVWLSAQVDERATNLFSWRGPFQNGTSAETYEQWAFEGEKSLAWTYPLSGRGCPVIVDGNLYSFGYLGDQTGADLQIVLACLDAETGEQKWEHRFNDFLSDTIYSRYSIGSPAVDQETRNVYLMTSTGLFSCFDRDGKMLWQHSLMETFGRLTFPNGRTGCPVIEGNLVIVRGITSFWGADGPARDRFLAFDKHSGSPLWSSTPGVEPKDSSYSTPVFETRYGMRVFYAGTGCGNIVCINAMTGAPLWRYQYAQTGVGATPVLNGDTLLIVHGGENLDTTSEGRLSLLNLPGTVDPAQPAQLDVSAEEWRNDLVSDSSTPVLVSGRAYLMDKTGNLSAVDAGTGEVYWSEKLDSSNLHSSPLWVDGILYVPTMSGTLFVIRPQENGAEVLRQVKLEGNCLGSPAVWNGRLYVHTTEKLYCFQLKTGKIEYLPVPPTEIPAAGAPAALQVSPNEVVLEAGESVSLETYAVDAHGFPAGKMEATSWAPYVPPAARVQARMEATVEGAKIQAPADAGSSAGMFKGSAGALSGTFRGRTFPRLPMEQDFESFALAVDHESEPGVKFAYPPLPWIGGRFKWEVRELEGNKVFAKTLDNVLFQRAVTFIGPEDLSGYTLQADVMTDGNRRIKGDVGLINQRYLLSLKGNWNQLEVSSNHERIKEAVSFAIQPGAWYTLKTKVDLAEDGSGLVRGKVWERDQPEPESWTIEVKHRVAHRHGAPGLFGFSPQSQKRVYIDNIALAADAAE
ncbi:MAG TPA: PQQ-binding-like beta-propeller repeat protein [Verrucomicrobiales bacterium]|nr:PQQ-binding-like beta-propeller repeat protein [Verrucomicrobiales bacterium]